MNMQHGLKTGYTDAAKYCIVAKANKDDMELICVVLGADKLDEKNNYRDIDCKTLFDYGFNNFEYTTICKKGAQLDLSTVENLPEVLNDAKISYDDTIELFVNTSNEITKNIDWNTDINLPIVHNSKLGSITYNIDGNDYTVALVAKENILEPETEKAISYAFYILLAALLIVIVLLIFKKNTNNKERYFKRSLY